MRTHGARRGRIGPATSLQELSAGAALTHPPDCGTAYNGRRRDRRIEVAEAGQRRDYRVVPRRYDREPCGPQNGLQARVGDTMT